LTLAAAPSAVAAASPSGGGSIATTPTNATTSTTSTSSTASTGGAGIGAGPAPLSTVVRPIVPGSVAQIKNGIAYAPSYAPVAVQQAIWAGNRIRTKPYVWGGGHAAFVASGYDCSGSVSYVLHAAGLLKTPFDSSDLMQWGEKGIGRWITVYTNPGHAFIEIAGIRFDTSAEADPHPARGSGPRWRPLFLNPPGFMARHPLGF
jgi:cell wall-associated NlpC family hydrolase